MTPEQRRNLISLADEIRYLKDPLGSGEYEDHTGKCCAIGYMIKKCMSEPPRVIYASEEARDAIRLAYGIDIGNTHDDDVWNTITQRNDEAPDNIRNQEVADLLLSLAKEGA